MQYLSLSDTLGENWEKTPVYVGEMEGQQLDPNRPRFIDLKSRLGFETPESQDILLRGQLLDLFQQALGVIAGNQGKMFIGSDFLKEGHQLFGI